MSTRAKAINGNQFDSVAAGGFAAQLPGDGRGVPFVNAIPMPIPAGGVTRKTYAGQFSTSTTAAVTQNLETVPAGKNFYLTDFEISCADGTGAEVDVMNGAVPIAEGFVKSAQPFGMVDIQSGPIVPAGNTLAVKAAQAGSVYTVFYTLYGFEW